jgi:phosphate transport system permease protein
MSVLVLLAVIAALGAGGFALARRRALGAALGGGARLHSLPAYYGWYGALWSALPGLAVTVFWLAAAPSLLPSLALPPGTTVPDDPAQRALFWNDVENLARGSFAVENADDAVRSTAQRYVALRERALAGALGLALLLGLAGGVVALRTVRPALAARVHVERVLRGVLLLSSSFAILVTIGIVLSLVFETVRFFHSVSPTEFLFGTQWSPQIAMRSDQVASAGAFGAVPLFVGTLLITAIAMAVALPIGLLSAIHMTFYASARARDVTKPLLEILAGVPTVVYGFFAALVVAPAVRNLGMAVGLSVDSQSALAAGLVMGIMIVPFVSSLSDDAITAVPIALRDGSFGLGATRSETIRLVIIPAALPGIVGGFLLAVSRAIGETMIVAMAAGLAANLTFNPLEAVTTVTVQIVAILTGDQEFDSAKTLAAFALGLTLFVVTLLLNVAALRIVKRYREKYD